MSKISCGEIHFSLFDKVKIYLAISIRIYISLSDDIKKQIKYWNSNSLNNNQIGCAINDHSPVGVYYKRHVNFLGDNYERKKFMNDGGNNRVRMAGIRRNIWQM